MSICWIGWCNRHSHAHVGVGVGDGDERPDPVGAEFADVDGVAGTGIADDDDDVEVLLAGSIG